MIYLDLTTILEENKLPFTKMYVNLVGKHLPYEASNANSQWNQTQLSFRSQHRWLLTLPFSFVKGWHSCNIITFLPALSQESTINSVSWRELGQHKLMVQVLSWRVPKNILFLTLFHISREHSNKEVQYLSRKVLHRHWLILFYVGDLN